MTNFIVADKNKQIDFFSCDVFNSYKDDTASMEHPIFSLSTKPDHRMLVYKYNGNTIKIKPSYTGLATIHDKDILLYLTSCLMTAKNNGEPISNRLRFIAYDYLSSTNKVINGKSYIQLQEGLERLSGTRIETDIKTRGQQITEEFGLLNGWHVVREREDGQMIAVEVVLSEWFYNSILGNSVLSIDRDYFKLRKPTDRRLYELARKHCGNQATWKIGLDKLKEKIGSNAPLRRLRFNINKMTESNHLPEYNIAMDNDVVTFTRKFPAKVTKDPKKIKKHISELDINKHAKPGESRAQVIARLQARSLA